MSFEEHISKLESFKYDASNDKNTGRNIIDVILSIIKVFENNDMEKAKQLAKWATINYKDIYFKAPESYSYCWMDLSLKLNELCSSDEPYCKHISAIIENKL